MRILKMAALASCVAAVGCTATPQLNIKPVQRGASNPTGDAYAEAKRQLEAGNMALAVDGFRRAVRQSPESVDALNGLAVAYDNLGRFDLSRRFYALALAADPTSAKVRHNMAVSQRMQGRTEQAQAIARPVEPVLAKREGVHLERTSPLEITLVTRDLTGPKWTIALDESKAVERPAPALLVLNGVGRRGQAARMRHYLAGVGWVGASIGDARQRVATSVIIYPRGSRTAAETMTAKLPFRPRMIESARARRIVLVLGRNATRFDQGLLGS
jgi:hypothetical protein